MLTTKILKTRGRKQHFESKNVVNFRKVQNCTVILHTSTSDVVRESTSQVLLKKSWGFLKLFKIIIQQIFFNFCFKIEGESTFVENNRRSYNLSGIVLWEVKVQLALKVYMHVFFLNIVCLFCQYSSFTSASASLCTWARAFTNIFTQRCYIQTCRPSRLTCQTRVLHQSNVRRHLEYWVVCSAI